MLWAMFVGKPVCNIVGKFLGTVLAMLWALLCANTVGHVVVTLGEVVCDTLGKYMWQSSEEN